MFTRLRVDTCPQSDIINSVREERTKGLTQCLTTFLKLSNGAEIGKINPTQAHELIGMVRLTIACGECDPLDRLVMRLEQSAFQQWKDRYACKPDADFASACALHPSPCLIAALASM